MLSIYLNIYNLYFQVYLLEKYHIVEVTLLGIKELNASASYKNNCILQCTWNNQLINFNNIALTGI